MSTSNLTYTKLQDLPIGEEVIINNSQKATLIQIEEGIRGILFENGSIYSINKGKEEENVRFVKIQ